MGTVAQRRRERAVGEDATFEKSIEFHFDKLGQGRSSFGFDLGLAFQPAPAAPLGPSSLNSCPSLTAIGIDSRCYTTPVKLG